jgi:hypothetical protein
VTAPAPLDAFTYHCRGGSRAVVSGWYVYRRRPDATLDEVAGPYASEDEARAEAQRRAGAEGGGS